MGDDVLSLDEVRWQAMADSPSPHWRAVRAQACFFATPAAEKALKDAILELGSEPPHCHVLGMLAAEGLDVAALAPPPLPALSRMSVTSRCPLDDTPSSELFEDRVSEQAMATAKSVLSWVEQLDQPSG